MQPKNAHESKRPNKLQKVKKGTEKKLNNGFQRSSSILNNDVMQPIPRITSVERIERERTPLDSNE
jgi:hypothetical protein